MKLQKLKRQTIKDLKEFCSRYTYSVFPEYEQRNAALGVLDKKEAKERLQKLVAYKKLYKEKKQEILATKTVKELEELNWHEGFDTLDGGVDLSKERLEIMLDACGLTEEQFRRKTNAGN